MFLANCEVLFWDVELIGVALKMYRNVCNFGVFLGEVFFQF